MSVHQVHPRSTFQKQFRRRPLRQQKAKRTFPFSPCRGSVQRHTLFREIPCIANRKRRSFCDSVQRHTISRGKTCIATAGYRKSSGTMQRHNIFRKIPCIAKGILPFCRGFVRRHTLSRRKTCIATAGYRKSSGTMQRHTIFREIPCVAKGILLTTHKKTTAAPQKKSARIGSD